MSSENCQAHTRKGNACRGKALSDSSYCRDHVGRANQFTSKRFELPKPDAKDSKDVNDAKRYDEAVSARKNVKLDQHSATKPTAIHQLSQSSKIEEPTVKIVAAGEMEVEDLYSSGSDAEDFVDAVQYDNGDEVEESEHLQHLRDVLEVKDDEEEDAISAVE
uniref:Uncharacterized protein n=1 Tax=Hyaloperonospora arabidopsidis (strain Emoy2) TaxID=559515 RepID=M4BU44_HYAAE